jgi:GT2 family glycosyltransferase
VKSRYGNRFNYIQLSRNLGYGAACNIAYAHTRKLGLRYKYYVCSNNDIELYPGALTILLHQLEEAEKLYPRGFIATPILINGYDGFIDVGGAFIDDAGGTWSLRLALLNKEKAKKILKVPMPVDYADGAFLIVHWRVAESIGLFSPPLYLYYDDVELSLRARTHKYPSILIPVILGVHYRSLTTSTMRLTTIYLQVRNRVYITAHYLSSLSMIKLFLWYLSYSLRILETSTRGLRDLTSKMQLGHVAYSSPRSLVSLSLLRYVTRAFIDGLLMAVRVHRHREGNAIKSAFHIRFIDMFNQKMLITRLQNQAKLYIIRQLQTRFK